MFLCMSREFDKFCESYLNHELYIYHMLSCINFVGFYSIVTFGLFYAKNVFTFFRALLSIVITCVINYVMF